jgi:iron(III) transport system ATP-binding protein
MKQGRIQQVGSPRDVYQRPQNRFVADFVGTTNFVEGTVASKGTENGFYVVDTEIGPVHSHSSEPVAAGDKVVLSIRPEDIHLSDEKPFETGANAWRATVDQKVFLGEAVDVRVKVGNRILLSRAHPSIRTPVGQPIWFRIDSNKSMAMPATEELRQIV